MTTDDRITRQASSPSAAAQTGIPQYEIRVDGRLGSRWAAWFDGLTITTEEDGTTVLRGPVVDQAALHGLLQKLRDLGIPLVSLSPLRPDAPAGLPELRNHPSRHNPSRHNPSGATS